MNTAKVYKDIDGNDCTIHQMVKREPEWAAARIQAGEEALAELATLREKARLYDEAQEQAPVGMFWHNGQGKWEQDTPERRIRGITVPLYPKPVPQAMAVPDGWQLVPKFRTGEMSSVDIDDCYSNDDSYPDIGRLWEKLLSAAPEYKP